MNSDILEKEYDEKTQSLIQGMVEAEEHRKEIERQNAELESEKVRFELERAKREAAARESAPWQDDAWDGEGAPPGSDTSLDNEVEWD